MECSAVGIDLTFARNFSMISCMKKFLSVCISSIIGMTLLTVAGCTSHQLSNTQHGISELQTVVSPTQPSSGTSTDIVAAHAAVQSIGAVVPGGNEILALLGIGLGAAGTILQTIRKHRQVTSKTSAIREILAANPAIDVTKLSTATQRTVADAKHLG